MAEIKTKKREHKATYAADKRSGGWMVRISGPNANRFAGKSIPVTLKDGSEHSETLEKVVWTGKDKESGENVALYKFKAQPKEQDEILFD